MNNMIVIGQEIAFTVFGALTIMVLSAFIYAIEWRDKNKDF